MLASLSVTISQAQILFGDRCLGTWKGMMHIYQYGTLRDSVEVKLTVAKTNDPNAWTWKTEYLSTKMPMVKDYVLRLKDKEKNQYVTDEGGGLELLDYLTGNKLYTVFETQGILLTSSYELFSDELIFEVTSGRNQSSLGNDVILNKEVTNYYTSSVQRVVFRKQK